MPFPLPPGFSELEQDTIDRLARTGVPSTTLPQPIMPPPAKPVPTTPVASQIDDSALRKALAETSNSGLKGLGNSLYNAFADPSTIGPGLVQFGKGAASGATLGLSEMIPGMVPDPESWAASAGNVAGFAVPGVGAAKGVAAGARFLPGALKTAVGSTLGSNVVSGAVLGPLDAKIRSSVEGTEEPNLPVAAAMGAAIPVAAHGAGKLVGAGLRRFFGKAAPEVANATTEQPVNPIKVLAPDMQAEYQKFVRARDVATPEAKIVEPPTAGGIPVPESNPAWDTVPLGGFQRGQGAYLPTGQPVVVRGIQGDTISYTGEKGIGIRPASELRPEMPPTGTPVLHTSGGTGTFEGEVPNGQLWFRTQNERGGTGRPVGPQLTPVESQSLRPLPEDRATASMNAVRGGVDVPPGDLHGPPPPVESARPVGAPAPAAAGAGAPPATPPPTTAQGAATPIGPNNTEMQPSAWEQGSGALTRLFRKLNLPIRVLGRNPETRQTMGALMNYSDATRTWETAMERQKARWEAGWTPEMKDFYKNAAAEYQGRPGIEAKLQQYPGTPQEIQALLRGTAERNTYMEQWRQGLVDRSMLQPEQSIENHLPWMRYKAIMPGEVKVAIDDSPRTVGYMNSWNMEHPRFRNFMLKTRNQTQDIPQAVKDMTLDELDAIKIKAIARGYAFHDEVVLGGKGQEGVVGQLQNGKPVYWIDQQLNGIHDPGLKQYAVDLVNHAAGVPKQSALLNSIMDTNTANKFAAQIRRLQFNHLIAGQFLTPGVNLTQTLITLSQVSTSNWGKAWKLAFQKVPHEGFQDLQSGAAMIPRDWAEKWAGASGTFNAADENVIQRGLIGKLAYQASKAFRWSERTNQRHAAIAGYLEARSRGLDGQEAVDFAKSINRYTQQFGGSVNTPEAFQGPIGSVLGQFKSYPIGFMGYMKDLFTRAGIGANMAMNGEASRINPITNQPETAVQHMKPLMKFLIATGALGGPSAFVNAFGEENGQHIVNYINDQTALNLPDWTKAGMLGYLGVDLSNQLGFGALPLSSNLKDMMWFLPGPALSNVADAATAASYLFDSAGINTIFSPEAGPKAGLALDPQHLLTGTVMGGISPDDFASRAIRAFAPVGGPQLDKIRKFYKNQQTGNDEVEALNILQSLGAEVPSGDWIRYAPDQAPIDKTLGIPEPLGRARSLVFNPLGRSEEIQHRAKMVEEGQEYTSALRTYHTLIAGGQGAEAQRFAEQFYTRTGMPLVPSDRALQEAYNRRMLPATVRMEQRAAWPIQVYEGMNR